MTFHIETINGLHLVRGGIIPKHMVRVGQVWASAGAALTTVVVTHVDPELSEVTYEYPKRRDFLSRIRDNYNFQCMYCLVVPTPELPEELQ
jgi:hypothetical protein